MKKYKLGLLSLFAAFMLAQNYANAETPAPTEPEEHFQCVVNSAKAPELNFYGYASLFPSRAKDTALKTCEHFYGSTCKVFSCWSIENRDPVSNMANIQNSSQPLTGCCIIDGKRHCGRICM